MQEEFDGSARSLAGQVDRRAAARWLAVGAIGATVNAANAAPVPAPALDFQFEITAEVAAPIEQGERDGIRKRIIPITGGSVQGPAFSGVVLPGGADWQTLHEDGTTEIYARYLIRALDGATVEVVNPGIRRAAPEIMRRLMAGEDLDPSLYYFRSSPSFATLAPAYRFLTENVFVATAIRRPRAAVIRVFKVL